MSTDPKTLPLDKRLALFAGKVIDETAEAMDVGVDVIQDEAEALALLVREPRTVPCCASCGCAEVYEDGSAVECLVTAPDLKALITTAGGLAP